MELPVSEGFFSLARRVVADGVSPHQNGTTQPTGKSAGDGAVSFKPISYYYRQTTTLDL